MVAMLTRQTCSCRFDIGHDGRDGHNSEADIDLGTAISQYCLHHHEMCLWLSSNNNAPTCLVTVDTAVHMP